MPTLLDIQCIAGKVKMDFVSNSKKLEEQEYNIDKNDRKSQMKNPKGIALSVYQSMDANMYQYNRPNYQQQNAHWTAHDKNSSTFPSLTQHVHQNGNEVLESTIESRPVPEFSAVESVVLESTVTGPASYSIQPGSVIESHLSTVTNNGDEAEMNITPEITTPFQMEISALLKQLDPFPTEDDLGLIEIEPSSSETEAIEDFCGYLSHITDSKQYMILMQAYQVASYAHREQKRRSGEPYIMHPIEVARILAELGMDVDTLAASLLHDVVEDTEFELEYISKHFSETVATLVDGVTKLKRIKQLSNVGKNISDTKAESLRKMFLAMVDDVRIVLIKLADRLHNMRTLKGQDSGKRERIARETLDIFAPLANRLGIWQIKWELEDLSFRYINPSAYKELARAVQQKRVVREQWVEEIIATLQENLQRQGISAVVTGRPKHIYSIWRKMKRKDVDFDEIYDVHGFRIMVDNVTQCYAALGVVHGLWRPIHGEFDDYIANPKDNMYRSLHTAVHSRSDDTKRDGHPMEIQIRTQEMHEFAELGIAAHWRYKEQVKFDQTLEDKIQWLRNLMEWGQDVNDPDEFIDTMKTDVFQERVYVFSPQGDVYDLSAGATPIDFAYSVHTELGHRCRGAKVDGRLVRLDYKLKTGEQVHILTAKRGGPSRDWLNPNLEYVTSQRARGKIRTWLRRQNREDNILNGRRLLEKEMNRLAVTSSFESVAKLFKYDKVDDFLAAIGYGAINSQHLAQQIIEDERLSQTALTWETAYPTTFSDYGPITTTGSLVTVHRKDCSNAAATKRRGRADQFLDVEWKNTHNESYPVKIQIHAYDRAGLINDVTNVVTNEKINILSLEAVTGQENNIASIKATLEISDVIQLTRMLTKVDQLPNVVDAHRIRS